MSIIKLLLGTDYIIEIFDVNTGNTPTTMGKVFYCTKIDEFACEWACKKNTDGFVNIYDFNKEELKILNLLDCKHTVFN